MHQIQAEQNSAAARAGNDFLWVGDNATLQQVRLTPGNWIAIDTEADSLHHYKESVCLVQLSQGGRNYLIDPLARGLDLAPLWKQLSEEIWILHGADFDLRMMRRIGAPEPAAVFDTMLACQLLGYKAFGYAALVEHFFGQAICKKNQKADWSRRPLPHSMTTYAVQDTMYLEEIAGKLSHQLRQAERLAWHEESCARVLRTSRQGGGEDKPDPWRIRGSNKLRPKALAILKAVWEWREQEAEKADHPVFKILSNDLLIKLSDWSAAKEKLPPPACPHWPGRIPDGRAARLIKAINAGRKAEPIAPPPKPPRRKHDPAADLRLEKLRAFRDHLSIELGIDPGFLAAKGTLQAIARDPYNGIDQLIEEDRWCRWQGDLFVEALRHIAEQHASS